MKAAVEGLLFVAGDEGLDSRQLADVLEIDNKEALRLVRELQHELAASGRGIQIVELANTFQLATLPEHASYFQKLAHSPHRASLSQAALETLSIIAYRQPITRVEIEEIRGVKAERALQTLVTKELIEEVGRAEAIGRPILYGTTKSFLDYFGLSSITQLPDKEKFEKDLELDEEARMLFDKLDADEQISMEELEHELLERQHAHSPEGDSSPAGMEEREEEPLPDLPELPDLDELPDFMKEVSASREDDKD
ncbi:SMC-Scp complex subunit ScpB [Paenibacillus sp. J31TS4]|uniref:SMC-Scp complex subunit ScpB n=1 Tax=Paenibacillus sp. J31TS4 TaxID=2807195 RepID=UPI0027960D7C|nr:SMC-Scp complex subunit ScpB [Paenibacillus sp. J31TS4]